MKNILGMNVDSYLPLYDDYSDYNTNAKSYYDYLARYNKQLKYNTEYLIRALNRNIEPLESNSNIVNKTGDWIENENCPPDNYDDVIKLSVDTKLSKYSQSFVTILGESNYSFKNGIEIKEDGLWYPDYEIVRLRHDLAIMDLRKKVKALDLEVKSILGLDLKILEKDKDYRIEFYNGFYSPTENLIIKVGETNSYLDIYIESNSIDGKILKHDGDLRTKTMVSLTPSAEYDKKCDVFSIEFLGDYSKYNNKKIEVDNTIPTLWHIRPQKARATWNTLLTPHNISGKFFYNWRQISDGYGDQLVNVYEDELSLQWGSVASKIKILK